MIRTWLLAVLVLASPIAAAAYPYANCFDLASRRHAVDLDLLLAIAAVESNWDADARSTMNAHGIMQIRWPVTARHLGVRRVAELYNPCLNIDLGARYLREMLDRFDGDLVLALAAYNFGPARLRTRNDIPGSVESYVDKVMSNRARVSKRLTAGVTLPAQPVELVRFDRSSRAEAFADGLRRQVPGAELIVAADRGASVVYIDPGSLGAADRHRLARLFPQFFEQHSPERRGTP